MTPHTHGLIQISKTTHLHAIHRTLLLLFLPFSIINNSLDHKYHPHPAYMSRPDTSPT